MGNISLTDPVAEDLITSGLHVTNYGIVQTLLNGNLDNANIDSMTGSQINKTEYLWYSATLSADTANYDIPGIPQAYTNLHGVIYGKIVNTSFEFTQLQFLFNGDITLNFYWQEQLREDAGVVSAALFGSGLNAGLLGNMLTTKTESAAFSVIEFWIPNFSGIKNRKQIISFAGPANGAVDRTEVLGVHWLQTQAINRITLQPSGADALKAGTRIFLYLS